MIASTLLAIDNSYILDPFDLIANSACPMAPSSHRKISRKELKEPDEFFTLFGEARDFLVANVRQAVTAGAIVVLAIAIAIGFYSYQRRQDRMVGDRFYNALTALGSKQYKSAEDQLTSLAADESNRRLGRLARFYLAIAYLGDNNLAQARDALVRFISEEHDPVFLNLALTNLGVTYERMGEFGKAANSYRQAATVRGGGPERLRAELGAARMLAKQGDKAGAIAAYRAFLAANPYAQQRQEAVESLALLGAQATAPKQEQVPLIH